jgi:hypothetical protein
MRKLIGIQLRRRLLRSQSPSRHHRTRTGDQRTITKPLAQDHSLSAICRQSLKLTEKHLLHIYRQREANIRRKKDWILYNYNPIIKLRPTIPLCIHTESHWHRNHPLSSCGSDEFHVLHQTVDDLRGIDLRYFVDRGDLW